MKSNYFNVFSPASLNNRKFSRENFLNSTGFNPPANGGVIKEVRKMEIIRKGSDHVFAGPAPRGCCFPAGTLGFRLM